MNYKKISILLLIIILLSGCGSSNTSTEQNETIQGEQHTPPTKKETALKKIINYADNSNNPKPTLQDYIEAGTTGVTAENLDDVNRAIDVLSKENIHGVGDINNIVLAINNRPTPQELALTKIINYADNNNNPKPTLQDYMEAGTTGVTAENLDDVNRAIDALSKENIHGVGDINSIIFIINNRPTPQEIALTKITNYADNSNNPKPTLQDYIEAGTTGVTAENLDKINCIINTHSKEETDSVIKLNTIINSLSNTTNNSSADMILEDGENVVTTGWRIASSPSGQSKYSCIYDSETSSRVIKFQSKGNYDAYCLDFPTQKSGLTLIKWDMKWFNRLYELQIIINTAQGKRTFSYVAKDTGNYIKGSKNIYAIGSNADNEQWHTITRDLEADLHRYEADNDFISIESFTVYGSGYIDNLELYKKDTPLQNIATPVVVASPGIVLTFDDTLIEDWYAMKDTFREKGVHATFFCNSWQNLSSENIAKFRELQNDGHEIAVHTKDHLSTYDGKYSDSENKAQAYLDDQVLPAIEAMNQDNFEPNSFSYPFISGQPKHSDLIRNHLPHIREFFSVVKQIDNPSETTYDFQEIQKVLIRLKETKNIGVFLAHKILPQSDPDTYRYRITTEKLIQVIDEVNRLGLKFYTLEEAHRVYIQE